MKLNLVATRRAYRKTGADFVLRTKDSARVVGLDLEDDIMFEVSGIGRGDRARLEERVNGKRVQVSKNPRSLVGVCAFKERTIVIA